MWRAAGVTFNNLMDRLDVDVVNSYRKQLLVVPVDLGGSGPCIWEHVDRECDQLIGEMCYEDVECDARIWWTQAYHCFYWEGESLSSRLYAVIRRKPLLPTRKN